MQKAQKTQAEMIAIVDNRDRYGVINGVKFRSAITANGGKKRLAEQLGITTAAIRNWSKTDRATIGVKTFDKVCKSLGITPADVGFEPDTKEIERKLEVLKQIKKMAAGLALVA